MNTVAKKFFWATVRAICGVKRRLPFFRVLIISDRNNWICINYDLMVIKALFSSYVLERMKFVENKCNHSFAVDQNFKFEKYKGINLFEVAKYDICVDLEEFPSEISFDNKLHRKVINHWFSVCSECIDSFEKIILEKNLHKILISQGYNFDSAIVRALSCLHGFGLLAVENTFFKDKIVWDDVSGITVNKNLAKNYFWKYRDIVDASDAEHYVVEYLKNVKKMKSAEHQTPEKIVDPSIKKTVLFIGQVYSDASILFGINDFVSPVDILECLVSYCEENHFHLVIKLHPKEMMGKDVHGRPYNDLTWRKISQRTGLFEKICANGFLLDKGSYNTYALIEMADICITVNSQAGLEALAKGKDLIVCGQSFYSGLGFTHEARDKEGLRSHLDEVLKQGVSVLDPVEINKFFYITCEKYFVGRSEESVKELLLR